MFSQTKRWIHCVALLSAFLLLQIVGCAYDASASGDYNSYTPFPVFEEDPVLPLADGLVNRYRMVQFGSGGEVQIQDMNVELGITKPNLLQANNIYVFRFLSEREGTVLWDRYQPADSAGVYAVGIWRNDSVIFGDTLLWFPADPIETESWDFGEKKMEVVQTNIDYPVMDMRIRGEMLEESDYTDDGKYIRNVFAVSEVNGDTTTVYYMRRNMGMLGFERSINGHLKQKLSAWVMGEEHDSYYDPYYEYY